MKKLISLSIILLAALNAVAQNVGIGTNSPQASLHIRRPMDTALLQLENEVSLDVKTSTGLYIRNGNYFTGAIKTIGTSTSEARLGFFTFADPSRTNLIERLTIADNGAVGIGTIAPNQRLDVAGRMRIRHTPNNTPGIWLNKSDNTDASFIGQVNDTTFGVWDATSSIWRFAFNHQNGRLGIGTTLPSASLSFANTVGNKISFWGSNPAAQYGIGIQGSQLQLYADVAGSDIVFGYGGSGNLTETMRIKGNGNVGIGTSSPTATLSVNGSLRLTDGSQGYKRVLTSDHLGNTSWQRRSHVQARMQNGDLIVNTTKKTIPFVTSSGGTLDSDFTFNNASHEYVVPSNGVYRFYASCHFQNNNATNTEAYVELVATSTGGGGNILFGKYVRVPPASSPSLGGEELTIEFLADLSEGDKIKLTVIKNNGNDILLKTNGLGLTYFNCVKIE